jgi:hypothetical protein
VWAKLFGGADTTGNWTEKGGIASDPAGHLAIAGFIAITNAVFDDFTLSEVGGEDVFVARLDADRPKLDLFQSDNLVIMSWPTNEQGFKPEGTNVLPPTNGWVTITNPIAVVGGWNFVTNPITATSQFYRLRKNN